MKESIPLYQRSWHKKGKETGAWEIFKNTPFTLA